ncbi:DUF3883 domain-containing protein [Acholeplasma vituli]|uniref:DUF3883 domain-containing protein n=1 Tax=Paracholeplasma vituli TaxID=69473 RepID=A0ABT2PVL2_9MOLU|nr:DUF3883 domain-containing protein [Paracholeplasma vituli]MCU0104995.1 DUF3883 domain-containing protein [Paracholeplasma vituli]
MSFFSLHNEKRIGYKVLSKADLGMTSGGTSHQTHIGLFGDVLTFLPNNYEADDSLVIYNKKATNLNISFDRIMNPDGTFRSPKIRSGGIGTISVLAFIRSQAQSLPDSINWYLIWFGLQSEQTVFFLLNDQSVEYDEVKRLGVPLGSVRSGRLVSSDLGFAKLVTYLESIVDASEDTTLRELEVQAQMGFSTLDNLRFRKFDIDKATELNRRAGYFGESLVDRYLNYQKMRNQIVEYTWYNRDKESYKPFDFCIEELDGNIIYLDVKTTRYEHDQPMLFTANEIKFVKNNDNNYHIYRVSEVDIDGVISNAKLRICKNSKEFLLIINHKDREFEASLNGLAAVRDITLSIQPSNPYITFLAPVTLNNS